MANCTAVLWFVRFADNPGAMTHGTCHSLATGTSPSRAFAAAGRCSYRLGNADFPIHRLFCVLLSRALVNKPAFIELGLAPARVSLEAGTGGRLVLRSPMPLGYPARCVGMMPRTWARSAPERTFLAERRAGVAAVTPDTVARLLFISGSTGLPKGIINPQRTRCSNVAQRWSSACMARAGPTRSCSDACWPATRTYTTA